MSKNIAEATKEAMALEKALSRATQTDGTISYSKMAMELNKAGTNATKMTATLASGGANFQASLQAANKSLALSNRSAITLGKTMKEIHRVFLQSFKFTAAQTVIRTLSTEIQKSVAWVKTLNEAVNNIGVVTGKNAEQLKDITAASIQASKDLKVAAQEYAEGALIFYQQGLNDEEVARRTEITIKAAKSANQSVADMSSQLTSIWNNYRMIGDEQERSASVGAALAAKTAVDFQDIAKAMQTAAAPAAQMGVEYNQLAAIIATVGDISQESASIIGNAYKTIFSRFQQLTTEGTDGEVTLNRVSSKLKSLGVEVLNMDGTLRNLGTVINEVGTNWDKWTQTQQTAIAQIVGGTRQYGQFLTLMNNFDKYQKNLETAQLEDGSTLEEQYTQALDSITAKAEQSAEAWKRAFGEIIPEDALKGLYDLSTDIGNVVGAMLKGVGGLPGILSAVGVALSGKIVPAIITGTKNLQVWKNSLTPQGRDKNIRNDYNGQRAELDKRISSGDYNAQETASMQTQKAKLELLKQIALKNEEINNKLKTATGSEKLILQQQQQRLQTAVQLVEEAMNESEEIQRQLNLQTQFNAENGTAGLEAEKAELLDQQEQKLIEIDTLWQKIGEEMNKPAGRQNLAKIEEYDALLLKLEDELTELEVKIDAIKNKMGSNTTKALDGMASGYGAVLKQLIQIERSGDAQTEKLVQQKAVLKQFLSESQAGVAEGSKWHKMFEQWLIDLEKVDEQGMGEFLGSLNDGLTDIGAMDEKLQGLATRVTEIVDKMNHSGGIVNPLDTSKFTMPKVDTSQVISGFTQMGMSAAGALTSVTSLYNVLSNPDMTGFEKFTAAAMQIPMVIMQVQQASMGVTSIMNQWAAATETVTIANMANAAAQKMGTAALTENQVALLAQYASLVANGTEQEIMAAKTQLAAAGITEEAIAAAMADTSLSKAAIAAKMFGFESAAALGAFLVVAALVAAAVAAIVFAWNEYQNSKPEAKLERASEAAKNLSEAETEAKNAAQGLADAFNEYKEAEKALENCKRGTDEWTEALRKANDAALALVDALPDGVNVGEAYSRDADGRIRINEDFVAQSQKSLDSAAMRASYAASSANIQASMARNDLAASNLGTKISNNQLHYEAGSEYAVSDQSAATITQLLTESAESFKNLALDDIEGFKDALKEAGVSIENLSDQEIQGFAADLINLGNATEAAREKMELVAKIAVDELLEGKNYDDDTKDVTGERIAAMTSDLTDKYLGALTNGAEGSKDWQNKYGDINKADTRINDELMARYNELTGNNYASSGNGVQGTDTNRIFEFIDEQGNTIKKSAKQMAEEMAAAEALLNVEGAAADISRDFDNINAMIENKAEQGSYNSANNGAMQARGVKDFIVNGNMNSLNDNELGAMADLTNEQIQESLTRMFNISADQLDQWAENYGYESGEAWAAAIHDAAEASKVASEHAGDQLTKTTQKMYDSIVDDGDLTVSAKENLSRALVQVFDNFDAQTAQQFTDILDKMGGDANALLQNLTDIDWETASPDSLKEKLNELGIDASKLSDEDLESLIKSLRRVGDASVDAAKKFNDELSDAASGIKDNNSIISDEDFQKLQEAGVNVGQFFGDMADGTHQLLGDADEFKQLIHSIQMGKLEEAKQNALGQMDDLESAKSRAGRADSGQEGAMAYVLKETGQVSNSTFEGWKDNGWIQNAEVAEEIRKAYADAGMSAEKIDEMMKEAANEAERAQAAMDNADFAFEVESAGLDLEETTRYAERLKKEMLSGVDVSKKSKDEMRLYTKAAQEAAINNQRLDRGIGSLKDNLKEYKKAIKDSNKGTAEWSEAMDALKNDLADIVGFDDADLLSDEFAEATMNSEDLQKAINGDVEAIKRLQLAAAEDMMLNIQVNNDLTDEQFSTVLEQWNYLKAELANGVEAGDVDQEKLLTSFNEMIAAGKMTKDQIEAALAGLHVSANVKTTYISQKQQVPLTVTETAWMPNGTMTVPVPDGNGGTTNETYTSMKRVTKTYDAGTDEADVVVPQYEIEGTTDSAGNTVAFKDAPSPKVSKGGSKFSDATGSNKGSGGSSGSKTPVKKVDKTKKNDKLRYKDNENAVEDITNALDRLSKANEHAFGPQKIRNINLMNVQLARQAKAYQALYDEAKMYTKLDAMALDSGLADFNAKYGTTLKAEYDGDNLLDNEMELLNIITDLQNAKIAEINAVEDELNKLADKGVLQDDPQVDALNKQLETLKENLSTLDTDVESMVKKNLDNYQEAIRKAEETMQAMVDILYQGLANEIEKYTIARDLHLQINELEQKHWEAIMDNMGAVGKLGKQVADMLKKSLGSINDSVERYTKHYAQMEEVQKRWENRDITLKAEYGISDEVWDRAQQSGMIPQEIMDEFEGDIDALVDLRQQVWDNLDKQWQNYIDTIQHYIDEYDRITDRLDKQASISDNLMHVIETVGFNYKWGADESKSYFKNMETQLDIVKNKAAAVNGELAVATNRRKEAEEELNKLLAGRSVLEFSNSANEAEMFEYNRIKEHYDDMASLEAELNAQRIELLAEAYDKATEYAEKWGEIIAHEADEALNGAFDTLDEAMDMYNQKRDIDTFFMDDVDKAFELNKLKREVEDVIDDISDPEQLERYNKLLAEIEAKKEAGVKMTEKDLEILRAQFDLEQARDAYQDARNAKNTMRLTRDASGNYTYVYSEDEQSVEDQEAKVEEAMHNIYKLNRDAADEYAETWLQLQVDWENYYKSIDQARYEQDVKYRDMVDQRMKWYAEQSDLLSGEIIKHNDNIDRSYTDMTLSVITNTEDMATTNDMYKEHHTQLKEKLVENYQEWIEKADETMREVGGSMSDLEQVVDEETDKMMTEVDNLREEIDRLNVEAQSALSDLGGFIGTWCNDVNREFDTVIAEIDRLIQKYLEMLRVMSQQADANLNSVDFDPNTDYAALYLAGKEAGKSDADLADILAKRDAKMAAGYGPANAASNAALIDIGKIWTSNPDLAKDALHAIQRQNWTQNDIDIKGVQSQLSGLNQNLSNLNNALTGARGQKIDQLYGGKDPDKTATGGLIKTPQVRSLAEEGPELVLNNADTENILNAVKAIRGVVQSQIGAVELGMIGKTGRIADITPYIPKAETQSVDQTVHIDASFPGVSAAAEIETALNNLIVQAAHYSLNNKQN